MNHPLAIPLFLLLALTGCDEASDLQRQANTAQNTADKKIAEVQADANRDMRAAQSTADKTISAVQADFMTMREDYRHATTLRLVSMDEKLAVLESRATTATGKAQADLQSNLTRIHASREVFLRDYATLDGTSGATWDDTKARLDREWDDLTSLVNHA